MGILRNFYNKFWLRLWGMLGLAFILAPVGRAENPWRIRINIPEYKLYLYRGLVLYQSFPVAVGKAETPSPTGNFTIVTKIKNPTWHPPDGRKPPVPPGPNNPLGKYWLGLDIQKYGIHGNSAPWSIGSMASLGCFRMNNDDIEWLFGVVPVGTPVEVVYRTMHGGIDPDGEAWLEIFPDIYRCENPVAQLVSIFNETHWIYRPHFKAFLALLSAIKRPAKIYTPQVIHIKGNISRTAAITNIAGLPGIDGFVWEGTVYISRNILKFMPITDFHNTQTPFFTEYLPLQDLNPVSGISIKWNKAENTLSLDRFLPAKFP